MRAIEWYVTLLLSLVLFGCNINPDNPNNDLKVSADSVVVQNLIDQSETLFNANKDPDNLFDQSLKDAEKIAIKNEFNQSLVHIYTLLGKRHRNRSNYLEALNYHKKALDIAINNSLVEELAECYNQIGVVYRRIDENSLALDMHLKAMRYAEDHKDTFNISVSLNGIGNINLSMARYQAAIEYFKRSMEISTNKRNRLGMAINTNNIGEAYLLLGRIDTALVYFFESLEINTEINSKVGQSICFNSIGDAFVAKGEPLKALDYLLKALNITREVGDLMYVTSSLIRVGETYLNLNQFDKAQQYLTEGLALSKRIGSKFMAEDAANNLALLYEKQNKYKEALDYYKLRATYKDSLINEKNIYHVTTLETVFESEKQKDKIEELHKNNEIQRSKIARQKVMIAAIMVGAILIALLLFLISRQSQLREKYRHLKHKQRLLRSQMNPHFIFNALSAIQVFILENDMDRSSRFLSDFAKLMRQVLRNSNYEYISLREEIDTLVYYIELQKLRFSKPFEVEITVDKRIEASDVMIPPMLTQPFIENAIEHGLRPIGGHGKIELKFMRENNHMVIEVDDNGIGFSHPNPLKGDDNKHDSMALKIVRERLEIIKRDTGQSVSFEILDKKSLDPFICGTIVKISIPLIGKNSVKSDVEE